MKNEFLDKEPSKSIDLFESYSQTNYMVREFILNNNIEGLKRIRRRLKGRQPEVDLEMEMERIINKIDKYLDDNS